MKTPLAPCTLWLLGVTSSLLLWLSAGWLQQQHEQQQYQQQQQREATLLIDNAVSQLNHALLAGQATAEFLLAEHAPGKQSNFQRFAPLLLADNILFDFVASARHLNHAERPAYQRQQNNILREYRGQQLVPASPRTDYVALEQHYPDNGKALPRQLDLAAQPQFASLLQQVSKSGRPALAPLDIGSTRQLVAFFSSHNHPDGQIIMLGINASRLLGNTPLASDAFHPPQPYRLQLRRHTPSRSLILDSQNGAPPRQPPTLVSQRTIGGQSLSFELYAPGNAAPPDNVGRNSLSLLALIIMATSSGLIVRHAQSQRQRYRLRRQQLHSQQQHLRQQQQQQRQQQQHDRQTILRLRTIVEGSADAMLVISQDGRISDLNRAAETMLGQNRDVLLTLPAGALISELQPQESTLGFAYHITPRIGRPFEASMIRGPSQHLAIEVSLSHVIIENDAFYIAVCRDISARKASEIALIRLKDSLAEQVDNQHHQLDALLSASPVAMAYVVARQFRQVNHAFLELFQRNEAEIIGESTRILYDSDEHFDSVGRQVYPMLYRGQIAYHEITLSRGDGSPQCVAMYGKAVKTDKPLLGTVWLYQDMSAQRAAADKLRHAKELAEENSRAKTEFLANMSHELRTPMHAILGFAEMGQSRADSGHTDKLRHYFERIHHSGQRLLTLLNDLLDLSKMEVGKMVYTMTSCDANQITQDAIDELRGLAQRSDIQLQLHQQPGPLLAELDAFRIGQLIRNLVGNAIKFSPPGASVDISIGTAADNAANLCLHVRDFGPGIPEKERDHIFNTFIQSSLTKTGAGGSGLGLAISREIVNAHHGHINVLAVTGAGAHFCVTLPRRHSNRTEESS